MRKLISQRVSVRFLVRHAEIETLFAGHLAASRELRKLCPAGRPGHREMGRRITPSSDVTDWMQIITNPGRSVAAGVVPRCLAGNEVL
jgi:hypothetical protein